MAQAPSGAEGDAADSADDLPFRDLAQALSVPCWISDAEGVIVWVNDAWLAYTGWDAARIQAEGLKALHDPAVYGDVVRRWIRVKTAGVADESEFPLRGRDGTLRPFRTRVTPLRDTAGRVTRWFGVNTDISAQSATEAQLRSSQEQWREVFERAGDGVFITDETGRMVEANAAACAMAQRTREELLAMTVFELIDQGEHDDLTVARSQTDSARDWRVRRKDGTFLAVEVSSRRLSDGRRLGVARDVSARRLAESAARQALSDQVSLAEGRASEAELRLLRFWDASRDLFAIVDDRTGLAAEINGRAWEATLGYPAEEVMRTPLMDLVYPDDRERTAALPVVMPGDRSYFGFENRYLKRDGGIVWLSWNVVRVGEVAYCSGRDITEEKRGQAELAKATVRLAQAQKMEAIGQVTGGVAHDFNNLLMVMGGQAELLSSRGGLDARAYRSLAAISDAARRGQDLTRRLLAFSRRQRLKPAPTCLTDRIAHLKPLLVSSLGSRVTLEIEGPADLWTVEVDPGEWETALLNMTVNARDAMPRGGGLSITARNTVLTDADGLDGLIGEAVEVAVADTGEGIAPDILPRVIDPFFTTKEVSKGTGLGLSQVDGFVQQSGGRLRIESQLGAGTTIRIYLPRVAAEPAPQVADPPEPGAARRLSLLCVEDNPEVADVTAGLLEELGHAARMVGTAKAALTLLDEGARPDLVLSDIVMAGELNGLGLAREIRERWPATPVLLVTGYSREAEAIGNEFPVLAKPFHLAELSRALQAAAGASPPSPRAG